MYDRVAVIDYGKGDAVGLARSIRSRGIYSRIFPYTVSKERLAECKPKLIIHATDKEFERTNLAPEVTYPSTDLNEVLLSHVQANWTMERYAEDLILQIRETVGRKNVLLGLSGGVDSSVCALLIHKAVGDRLKCVFVDHGLLRKDEGAAVKALFEETYHINLTYVHAEEVFLSGLKGVTDPEEKRKIIGKLFVDTFYEAGRKLGDISFLAQGTIYPDIVESVQPGRTLAVKSHHNVGGLPEDLSWELLEPLSDLFKDEVRALGRVLGLPDVLLGRHPFPGPGLGVRCIGAVTKERLETLKEVDAIFIDEIRKANLYDEIWQALATLLPVKSVGVKDGKRVYEEVCTLRAVNSVDAMSASIYPFSGEFMNRTVLRILNEVPTVSRVLWDVSPKPPGTIEWE
ncbi:MAG TPA: glutamine-hydrolyzing GMP synthase [Sphaerochaeta sp.]|nr:glutamine-hydrolyzing GMP synthase [Sphaerochaeta sp.]